MKIKIQSSGDLNRLLDTLANDVVDARIYYRLHCDLTKSVPEYQAEFNQTRAFWHLTFNAIHDAWLSRLCRVYDQQSKSLNLVNLLDTIIANRHLFGEAHFRDRLSGNAFVDSLARTARTPDESQLDADIRSVKSDDPLVRKLMLWRNNRVAHTGARSTLSRFQLLEDHPLPGEEIEQLLTRSLSIYNRYSRLYRASTSSSQMVGADDYQSLLRFLRFGLQKYREDIETA